MRIGVNADAAEIESESRLHKCPRCGVERPPAITDDTVDNRRSPGQSQAPGSFAMNPGFFVFFQAAHFSAEPEQPHLR